LVVPRAEPSPKFQLNVYGVVPPLTVAVKVTGFPVVGLELTVKLVVRGVPATVMVWLEVVVAVFASVTVSVTVLLPFVEYV